MTRFGKRFQNSTMFYGYPVALSSLSTANPDRSLMTARKMVADGKTLEQIRVALGYNSISSVRTLFRINGITLDRRHYKRDVSATNNPEANKTRSDAMLAWHHKPVTQREPMIAQKSSVSPNIHGEKSYDRIDVGIWKGAKITVPKWHEEARNMRYVQKMSIEAIAEHFGVSTPRISQITSENWMAHVLREKVRPDKRQPVEDYVKELREAGFTDGVKQGGSMPDRIFEPIKSKDPNDHRHGVKIVCGNDDCKNPEKKDGHTVGTFFKGHGVINPTHAAQKFREAGWTIGGRPQADRCPHCVANLGKYTPPAKEKSVNVPQKPLEAVAKAIEAAAKPQFNVSPAKPPMPSFAPPAREIAREDRRLITLKLTEVYGDNAYNDQWTDAKVATDLGVPVEWVSRLRDENFGPEVNVDLARKAEAEKMRAEINALKANLVATVERHNQALLAMQNEHTADIKRFQETLSALALRVSELLK